MRKNFLRVLSVVFGMVLWAGVVFWGTVNGWFHQSIVNGDTTLSFLETVDAEIKKEFVGNLAIAVIESGEVEQEKFYTVGKTVDRHTVFQVASLSKWISAFGVMKLVEEGKLDLDAPVSKYLTRWHLPPSEFDNEQVTVRRLLSHRAGLTDGLGYSGFEPGTPVQSIEQSLSRASDADEGVSGEVRVGLQPGSKFKYSGGGYTLLQLLVEEVSGQSFSSYMRDRILQPLHMDHSSYVWSDTSNLQLAEFYNEDGSGAAHYQYTSLAATSLYTSLSDLEIFCQTFLEGRMNESVGRNVLRPETLVMMREPHAQAFGVDIWGLGTILYLPIRGDDFIIGHDGKSTPPINTAVRLDPQTGDGIIVLATGSPTIATRLASEWVLWKYGKADTLLFPSLVKPMFRMMVIGWVVIIFGVFLLTRLRRKSY